MFENIIFDLDSVLVTIEGIDELARMNNAAHLVEPLTKKAMNHEISFEEVFETRLQLILPTKKNLEDLGTLYGNSITQGAHEILDALRQHNTNIFVISGGYNPAVSHVTTLLGIPSKNVFANTLLFDRKGNFAGVNKKNKDAPLWKNDGKATVIRSLKKKYTGRFAFISDSDFDAGTLVHRYICFAGVAYRPQIAKKTPYTTTNSDLSCLLPYME